MKDKFSKTRDRLARIAYTIMGLTVLATGLLHVRSGGLVYHNYKGLGVFAPVAVIGGLILLYGVAFQWASFRPSNKQPNEKQDDEGKHKH